MNEKLKMGIGMVLGVVLAILMGFVVYQAVRAGTEENEHPVATFEIQDYGTVKVKLYPEYAPNTVTNFIALIQHGFYDNKKVYGKDDICLYMARDNEESAQGPKLSLLDETVEPDSEEDYSYEIKGEFIANEFEQNTLRHEKGILSLNRSDYSAYGLKEESYNSGSYRFSVLMTESSNLNGVYCAFGEVTEGLEILEKIYNEAEIQTSEEGSEEDSIQKFANMPTITKATVETYGVDYGKPEVHEAFDFQGYMNELYSRYISY